MYQEHFGIQEFPFSLTPDTSFFFNASCYQEALNVLLVALRSGEGFIKLTGEVGTGKTLLCRKLLNTLGEDFVTAFLPNPYLTPSGLRMALADELGLSFARNTGQHRLLKLITERLIEINGEGKSVVLCLDEAQAMPQETLESLRLLTNLETEKHKLLQVVMFGQPELDAVLARPAVRQLRQRITFAYRLRPIDAAGLRDYVVHRLQVAGSGGRSLLSEAALQELSRASRGIPRLVNILCHKAMMAAYGQGATRVSGAHMRRAIDDTEDVHLALAPRWPRFASSMLVLGALLAAGFGVHYFQVLRHWPGILP